MAARRVGRYNILQQPARLLCRDAMPAMPLSHIHTNTTPENIHLYNARPRHCTSQPTPRRIGVLGGMALDGASWWLVLGLGWCGVE